MVSPEGPTSERRPSHEEFLSSNIVCAVYGQVDNQPHSEHYRWPRCDIHPDRRNYPHLWSERHTQVAQTTIALLKDPTTKLLDNVAISPKSSVHFEQWLIRISLDALDEDSATIPLEERISLEGMLRGSIPEIAPQRVLALVAEKLEERIALETKAGR